MAPSRRTHIVRCLADKATPDDNYIDVEVLDAVSFRGPNGQEMVLNFKKGNVVPYIVDKTGGGHEKTPGNATRLSHMQRIKGDNGSELDVEVCDIVSFRTTNGDEYIMDLPAAKASAFSTNGTSDGGNNTRRTHDEKIGIDGKKFKEGEPYITITRTDAVAFRTILGKEMIIKMPSSDGDDGKRADTFTTPTDYDPTNEDGPKPPINSDPNVYVAFPEKTSNPMVGSKAISQGPFWWIRKIKSGTQILVIQIRVRRTNNGSAVGMKSDFGIKATNYDSDGGDLDIMPFKQPPDSVKIDELDFKNTTAHRGNNSKATSTSDGGSSNTDFTALLFVSVASAKKKSTDLDAHGDPQKITVDFTLPKLPAATASNGGTGYYWWVVSGGDALVHVPIHPPPDASNFFEPYPFGDIQPGSTYGGLWNGQTNFGAQAGAYAHFGIPLPPDTDAGALGWSTSAKRDQAVAAINAFGEADLAEALANQDPEHPISFPPPNVYTALTIDFDAGAPKKATVTVDVTATLWSGLLNFPFTSDNALIGLPTKDPFDPNVKTASQTVTSGDPAKVIRVTLDKDTGLSITFPAPDAG